MLPNLIIIGGQKCGTTSLHYYLGLHPQVGMSRTKELNFFIEERNWHKGPAWYDAQFNGRAFAGVQVVGEASPGYTNFPFWSGVPRRMQATVPGARLIFLVRDPIARIVSQFVHDYDCALGRERGTLEEALAGAEDSRYVRRSRQFFQLSQFLEFYPRKNVLVLAQEALRNARRQTLQQVFRFLEVEETFYAWRFRWELHRSTVQRRMGEAGTWLEPRLPEGAVRKALLWPLSRAIPRPVVQEDLRRRLEDLLRDDVDALRHWTGQRFEEWSL
ncbi:MAG: sulfotransferase [Acidobacteria bacterium]|nr:sulfotransferase [Acidobacteriota bacterium]